MLVPTVNYIQITTDCEHDAANINENYLYDQRNDKRKPMASKLM